MHRRPPSQQQQQQAYRPAKKSSTVFFRCVLLFGLVAFVFLIGRNLHRYRQYLKHLRAEEAVKAALHIPMVDCDCDNPDGEAATTPEARCAVVTPRDYQLAARAIQDDSRACAGATTTNKHVARKHVDDAMQAGVDAFLEEQVTLKQNKDDIGFQTYVDMQDLDGRLCDGVRKPVVVDGLLTRQNWLSEAQQGALLRELDSFPYQSYVGKSCHEFGQPFTFYVKTPTAPVLPPVLRATAQRAVREGLLETMPNYALINLYEPGQGIHPHVDDDFYTDEIMSIALGSPARLKFKLKHGAPYWRAKAGIHPEEIGEKAYNELNGTGHVSVKDVEMHRQRVLKEERLNSAEQLSCGSFWFTPGSLFRMKREARYGWDHEMMPRNSDRLVTFGNISSAAAEKANELGLLQSHEIKRGVRVAVTFRHVKPTVVAKKSKGEKVGARSYY